jgi:hypothetical protein
MVFNATLNNISDISLWSVLLVEETRVLGENYRPVSSHYQNCCMQGQQAYGMQQQAPPGKLLYIIDIPGMIYVLWIFNTAFIQHMVVGFTNTYAISAYHH